MATTTQLQFDGWSVNRVSGEISRAGRAARLAQQPLRILLELADRAGEIVTREQLVKALWPQGIVDFDNGLNVAMRKLRVALDDVGDTPRYIETLPKVGYRFIGKKGVAPEPRLPRGTSHSTRFVLIFTLLAIGIAIGVSWWWNAFVANPEPPTHHVPSVRAQELYLEGLQQRSRRDVDASPQAREKFEAALREDPQYAEAWAALGEAIDLAVLRHAIKPAEGIATARAAGLRAIELDPNLPQGHNLLASIYQDYDKDFAAAQREYDRSKALNPTSARLWHHLSMLQGQLGRTDEALASLRRARELEPMTPVLSANYGLLLFEARRYDEAVAFLTPLVEANPNFSHARSVLARALLATGDLAGAQRELAARDDAGVFQAEVGVLYAKLGRRDDALKEIERLEAMGRDGFGMGYDEALIYTALGELDEGCEALGRAVTDHSGLVNWMRLEPWLDPLRGRQCFADAEKKLYR